MIITCPVIEKVDTKLGETNKEIRSRKEGIKLSNRCSRRGAWDKYTKKALSSVVRRTEATERRGEGISIRLVCEVLGYTRQNYYKRSLSMKREEAIKQRIRQKVCDIRKKLPRLGTRKVLKLIGPELQTEGIKCGRDKLFE